MKIQELMMKKLSLPTWEEVEQSCPKTSSYKALEEFFIVFREWVSVIVVLDCWNTWYCVVLSAFVIIIFLIELIIAEATSFEEKHVIQMKAFQVRLSRTWKELNTRRG